MAGRELVLGMDGGGTKTVCAVADRDGNVLGVGKAYGSNFQAVGVRNAGVEMAKAIEQALQMAKAKPADVVFAAYGMAGADRDEDFETFHNLLDEVSPTTNYLLVNDTTIALRAGTPDGVGVARVAGTGTNTVGFNAEGKQWKVGGMGELSGDYGSGTDLAKKMVVAAFEASDGRGPKTMLVDLICKELGLKRIEDIVALFYFDDFRPIRIETLAPLLFRAAKMGDRVAQRILTQTGRRMGYEIVVCLRHLFKRDEPVRVVLGGSVLQKGESPILVDALKDRVLRSYPNARLTKLGVPPVFGAVLFALDEIYGIPTPHRVRSYLRKSLHKAMKVHGSW